MTYLATFLFIGFAIAVVLFIAENFLAIERGHEHIHKLIKRHGGTQIFVHHEALFAGQNYLEYEVSFRDVEGILRRTRCKMEREIGRAGAIFWRDEPFLPGYRAQLEKTRLENADLRSRLAYRSITKEQIISRLTAENEQLRLELEKLKHSTS